MANDAKSCISQLLSLDSPIVISKFYFNQAWTSIPLDPSIVAKEVIQERGSPHCDPMVEEEGVGERSSQEVPGRRHASSPPHFPTRNTSGPRIEVVVSHIECSECLMFEADCLPDNF